MEIEPSYPGRLREAGPPRGKARFAGILLHGRDRTPEEIIDIAFDVGHGEAIRWIVPEAENSTWYPNRFTDPLATNEPFLTRAVEQCDAALWEASEAGRLGPQELIVLGFSQGACLALEYILRRPRSCGAVLAFTGALLGTPPEIEKRTAELGQALTDVHVFLTGSDKDDWISEEYTRESARYLSALGADLLLQIYPGRPHIVSVRELAEARKFVAEHVILA